jgi:hypothetical protein
VVALVTRDNETDRRAAYLAEAAVIEECSQRNADAQNLQAAWWRRWNTLIAVSAALLASAAGASTLASGHYQVASGIAALLAGALSAAAVSLGSSSRSSVSYASAASNQTLADRAWVFRNTIAPFEPIEQVEAAFSGLCSQRDKLNVEAPLRLGVRALQKFRDSLRRNGPDETLSNQGDPDSGADRSSHVSA